MNYQNYQKVLQILDNFDYRDFDYIKGCGKALPLIIPSKEFPEHYTDKSNKLFERPILPCKKGINSEKQVLALLNLFDVDSVYLSKPFTVLDVDYMTDIAIRKDNLWVCFQVKSSENELKKVNYSGAIKPVHIYYEHRCRNILFEELKYFLGLLDISLKVDIEGIKKEYIPIIKKIKSISVTKELDKFEILKPGIKKDLHTLFSVGILNNNNETYHLS